MGSVVSSAAFPVPKCSYGRGPLNDIPVVELSTDSGVMFPLLHLRRRQQRSKYTILYSHGNAEDLGICAPFLEAMSLVIDCDVVGYDYCGYGTAEGQPSEQSCYSCIHSAYRYLTEDIGIPGSEIVVFGRSLGSGPSTDLASKISEVGGLILLSPLESAIRVVLGKAATACFFWDIFPNLKKIKRVCSPVLIMHGEEDEVINVSHGKNLYKAAKRKDEPLWIPDVGHNDIPMEEIFRKVDQFLKNLPKL
eukprot:Plantae.Rhodophyta-Purpureofilum_apyrenoidigerum.ctg29423.p1 GENE.Plantae.Rhodophyta-Purpureofilum_apyrenoidigerum.ctg29423~~Plantae.Rhodophyta-Purpureofilum_apyrenoidigerum.ctg29423.p1  ORF type:complete len:249 (-),score=32.63 Plantae.Rhodophyta-Purpureofilum_apyrenoidigerum.ctg29423:254-1000(-)